MFLKKFSPENNEKIIFQVHRHWIVFLQDIFLYTVILILFIYVFIWVYYSWVYNIEKLIGIPRDFVLYFLGILLFIYCIFYIIVFWNKYIDWFYDVLILTDKRIVEINQKFLFGRETRTLPLDQITSVKSSHHGIIGTILKFGKLYIETATHGTSSDIIFDYVANHEQLQAIIQDTKAAIINKNKIDNDTT